MQCVLEGKTFGLKVEGGGELKIQPESASTGSKPGYTSVKFSSRLDMSPEGVAVNRAREISPFGRRATDTPVQMPPAPQWSVVICVIAFTKHDRSGDPRRQTSGLPEVHPAPE